MFRKVLVANRGEIALRVLNACRELGIRTVAVYSEADRNSLHVRFADEAICIGPPRPADSYLNVPAVISAAEIADVDAIHPGYGLLSENANFAEVCRASNIKFIGPPPEVTRLMGEKEKARQAMKEAKVPILPGSDGVIATAEEAQEWAHKVGYPVILKAKAGGGGRGMRIVRTAEELPNLFHAASTEAANAFGNGELYMEKFIEQPRHIEFQMLADEHGNVTTLFERECSIQRRHQKLIEEAPSLQVTPKMREEIGKTLCRCLTEIGYQNAGTVEFLMDEDRQALLHRDEHAHPGGAPGHRGHHRRRSGEGAVAHCRRREARAHSAAEDRDARPRHRVPHQRRASRRSSRHRPARSPPSTCPAATASASIRRSMPKAWFRPTTTR